MVYVRSHYSRELGVERHRATSASKLTLTEVFKPGLRRLLAIESQAVPPGSQHNPPYVNGGTNGSGVHSLTGTFSLSATDVVTAGRGPSPMFVRAYNSNETRVGALGPGWTHNYDMRLVDPNDGSGQIVLVGPQGRRDRYTLSVGSIYTPPPGVFTKAIYLNGNGTYALAFKDQSLWTFDANGRLISLQDRHFNGSNLSYDSNGRLTAVSDPGGRGSLTFGYDSNGRLTSVTDWLSPARTVQYEYDSSGRLKKAIDRLNHATQYAYDGATSRLTTITDRRNIVRLTNTYDGSGRIATQADALAATLTMSYTSNGSAATYPTTSFAPAFQPVMTDTYNGSGFLTTHQVQPAPSESSTWTYTYNGIGAKATAQDPRGHTTQYCYDIDQWGNPVAGSRGNLAGIVAPPPATGANPPTSIFLYDSADNLTRSIPPRGVASWPNVSCGTNLSSAIDVLHATDYTYDASQKKLITVIRRLTDPEHGTRNAIVRYDYTDTNNPGLVTAMVPARGNEGQDPNYNMATQFAYNSAGLLVTKVNPIGDRQTYVYDAVGRKVQWTDENGNVTGATPSHFTWNYEYDAEDGLRFARAPAPTAGGTRPVTESQFDPERNLLATIDANGNIVRYAYDDRSLLRDVFESPTVADPNNDANKIQTRYEYDNFGALKQVTRAKGSSAERQTEYSYDGLRRLRRETQYPNWPSTASPLVTQLGYDAAGNQTSLVDPKGQTTAFSYDPLNRLTNIDYVTVTSTPDVQFTYDPNGNRATMTDGTGTTSYAYDEQNHLLRVTSPNGRAVGYRYTVDGLRLKLIVPDGAVLLYTRNDAAQVTTLTEWASRSTELTYYPDGKRSRVTNLNGTYTAYTYDNARRLTKVSNQTYTNQVLSEHTYTLDLVGNRTRVDETVHGPAPTSGTPTGLPTGHTSPGGSGTPNPNAATRALPTTSGVPNALPTARTSTGPTTFTTYSYDRLYRMLEEDGPVGEIDYTYDPVGNRLTKDGNGTVTAYTYDKADRISSAGGVTYVSDANGNLIARGSDTLTYDQANRLVQAVVGGVTSSYTYDGDGKRTRKVVGSTTRNYMYDTSGAVPKMIDDGELRYIWRGGLAYAASATSGQVVHVYHTDGLDSARLLTDVNGTVTDAKRTDAFGDLVAQQGASTQPFGFAGEQRDAETELMPMGIRSYDPKLGRFIQRDILLGRPGQPASLNRFAYSLNNPVRYVDPSGMDSSDTVTQDVTMDLVSTCCDSVGGDDYAPSFSDWVDAVMAQVSWAFDYGAYDAAGHFDLGERIAARSITPGSDDDGPWGPMISGAGAPAPGLFVVTPRGAAVPVPTGATGPNPTRPSGNPPAPHGFQFNGGTGGGPSLGENVTDVRIMDPTPPRGNSPGYPHGAVVYSDRAGNPVMPDGSVPQTRGAYHIPLP